MPMYFAFGSNMDRAQMEARCPGAKTLGMASLEDHHLVFRGPSKKRGGGVLSVDSAQGEEVQGLLYEVTEEHLCALDRFEGAPAWYQRARVSVVRSETKEEVYATIYRLGSEVEEMPPTLAYAEQVAKAFEALEIEKESLNDALERAKEVR